MPHTWLLIHGKRSPLPSIQARASIVRVSELPAPFYRVSTSSGPRSWSRCRRATCCCTIMEEKEGHGGSGSAAASSISGTGTNRMQGWPPPRQVVRRGPGRRRGRPDAKGRTGRGDVGERVRLWGLRRRWSRGGFPGLPFLVQPRGSGIGIQDPDVAITEIINQFAISALAHVAPAPDDVRAVDVGLIVDPLGVDVMIALVSDDDQMVPSFLSEPLDDAEQVARRRPSAASCLWRGWRRPRSGGTRGRPGAGDDCPKEQAPGRIAAPSPEAKASQGLYLQEEEQARDGCCIVRIEPRRGARVAGRGITARIANATRFQPESIIHGNAAKMMTSPGTR